MKAAYFIAPETLELREVPEPEVPEDGLLLEMKACGICGSDIRRWREGPAPGGRGVVPGHEASGIVCGVGRRAGGFAEGDRVAIAPDIHCGECYFCRRERYNLCDNLKFIGITEGYAGGFAEKLALTGEVLQNGIVNRIPEGLSMTHAAVSELCCSVIATHEKVGTGQGDTVVVIGAGPAGCLHVALAKSRGARVIVLEVSDVRRELTARFGPDLVLDPSSGEVVSAVRDHTGGIGADLVICANPVSKTQALGVEIVRKGGKVVLFGGLPKANPMTVLNGNLIHYGEIEVVGSFSYHPRFHPIALALLAEGKLPVERLITHTFTLDRINEAYRTAAGGEALKVVIEI